MRVHRPTSLVYLPATTGKGLVRLSGVEGLTRSLLMGTVPLIALDRLGSKSAVSQAYTAGAVLTLLITLNIGRTRATDRPAMGDDSGNRLTLQCGNTVHPRSRGRLHRRDRPAIDCSIDLFRVGHALRHGFHRQGGSDKHRVEQDGPQRRRLDHRSEPRGAATCERYECSEAQHGELRRPIAS